MCDWAQSPSFDDNPSDVRFTPASGPPRVIAVGPRSADIVAKVRFSLDNEVPHIFTWKSPVQPKEILIASAKRLLQQNRPIPDLSRCTKLSKLIRSPGRRARAATGEPPVRASWRF